MSPVMSFVMMLSQLQLNMFSVIKYDTYKSDGSFHKVHIITAGVNLAQKKYIYIKALHITELHITVMAA